MHLALNTFVYEVAKVPIHRALASAGGFGFRFIEYAAYSLDDLITWHRYLTGIAYGGMSLE